MGVIFKIKEPPLYDVAVVGGGLAGTCASLAAARQGARVALVHNRPVLGGNASSEIRVPPRGAGVHNPYGCETGIGYELYLEERARNHEKSGTGYANSVSDLVLYDAVRSEAELDLYLETTVDEIETDGDKRILSVTGNQQGSETRWRIRAHMFIDASGDGVVGCGAGIRELKGQESRSEYGESLAPEKKQHHTLGSSLMFRARDVGTEMEFEPPRWAVKFENEDSLKYRPHKRIDGGYWWIEIGYPYDTIEDNEILRDRLLAHVTGVWDHIKNHCPGHREEAKTYVLDWIGTIPAKRESRRFPGHHVMCQQELMKRELFTDRAGYGGWVIDDHTREGILDTEKAPSFHNMDQQDYFVTPYPVPLACMYVDYSPNLWLAGRVLGTTRIVMNSLRVMHTLAALGQSAGTAAAYAAFNGLDTSELGREGRHIESIQCKLLKNDVYIPAMAGTDPADLAHKAVITASSEAEFTADPGDGAMELNCPHAQLIPAGNGGLDKISLSVENRSPACADLRFCLTPADDIWDLDSLDNRGSFRPVQPLLRHSTVKSGFRGWLDLDFSADDIPAGLYWIRADSAEGLFWNHSLRPIPGLTAAAYRRGRWWFYPWPYAGWKTFAVRVSPDPACYGPENAVNGVTRPERRPNLWRSDVKEGMPQQLLLTWEQPRYFDNVHLTFDTDLSRHELVTPPRHNAPEAIRDYDLMAYSDNKWNLLCEVRGNYQRKRIHNLKRVKAKKLKLCVLNTNGVDEARLFEIRVYDKSGRSGK